MKRSERILVAGIGNIFHGDDAFGIEVVRELTRLDLPESVRIIDFGIRGYDLAYAITDGYEGVILVDATSRGEAPGTLYLMELAPDQLGSAPSGIDGHSLNPVAVLQMVRAFEQPVLGPIYLVGCEPAVLISEEGSMELSEAVATAVPGAVAMIIKLLQNNFKIRFNARTNPGLAEAVI
jgi:hydrogenase maturation protease